MLCVFPMHYQKCLIENRCMCVYLYWTKVTLANSKVLHYKSSPWSITLFRHNVRKVLQAKPFKQLPPAMDRILLNKFMYYISSKSIG